MKDFKEEKEIELKEKGYKYLGWQVHSGNCEEIKKHKDLEHSWVNGIEESISYSKRGSHDLHWCDKCRIFWNIDCSD